jgi:opacity protein-like surface antigen
MHNNFKVLLGVGLIAASSFASAAWTTSGGYASISDSDDGIDLKLGAVYVSAGYEFLSTDFTIMPELRLGVGVTDDTVLGVNVEVDSFIAFSVRGTLNLTNNVGLFLQPTYTRLDLTANAMGQSESADDSELGFGGGASYKLSDMASIEAAYEVIDGTDVISFGYRYHF